MEQKENEDEQQRQNQAQQEYYYQQQQQQQMFQQQRYPHVYYPQQVQGFLQNTYNVPSQLQLQQQQMDFQQGFDPSNLENPSIQSDSAQYYQQQQQQQQQQQLENIHFDQGFATVNEPSQWQFPRQPAQRTFNSGNQRQRLQQSWQTDSQRQRPQRPQRPQRQPQSQRHPFPRQQNPRGSYSQHQQQPRMQQRASSNFGATRRYQQQVVPAASSSSSQFPAEVPRSNVACTTGAYPRQTQKFPDQGSITKSQSYERNVPRGQNPVSAGNIGHSTYVETNMYKIIFHPQFATNAVHYDIDIEPAAKKDTPAAKKDTPTAKKAPPAVKKDTPAAKKDTPEAKKDSKAICSKAICRAVFEKCRLRHFPQRYPAFDGKKNAYSANDLPFNDSMIDDIEMCDKRNRTINYKITIKKVANIDLSWLQNVKRGYNEADKDQTGIQVLDVIFRHAPASRLLCIGRSMFSLNHKMVDLSGGITVYLGSFLSSILGWKPYLNIDVVHKGFVKPLSVDKIMLELTEDKKGKRNQYDYRYKPIDIRRFRQKIEMFLTGLRIAYAVPNQPNLKRNYRINGLGESARAIKFDFNGCQITVERYFKQRWNYVIKQPESPCLRVQGSKNSEIHLPAELCTIIEGQPIKDSSQSSELINYAAQNTSIRKDKIKKAMEMLNVNDSSILQSEFHLSVSNEMTKVEAKVLPALEICYQSSARLVTGQWRPDKFKQAINLPTSNSWSIINTTPAPNNDLAVFADELVKEAKYYGMELAHPNILPGNAMITADIHQKLESCKHNKLVIVVVPDDSKKEHREAKKFSELKLGLPTQCIKISNVKKCQSGNKPLLCNLIQQINSKLNGTNHIVAMTGMPDCLHEENYMFIGADVSHPSPDCKNIPSIAAISASHDKAAMKYSIEIKLQEPKQEMIAKMTDMIYRKIGIYKKYMGKLPTRIIYYRDGVSEGQLAQVLDKEIPQIKEACLKMKKMEPSYNPQIACIVVQKRHHMRIFPLNNKGTNANPGTVIDKEITHPNDIEFYLLSHAAIRGTARPTKYRCIYNKTKLTGDDFERLTYYLCHTVVRCTRTLSYPVPTYYAHLAAFHARILIDDIDIKMERLEEVERNNLTLKMENAPMFFV